MAGYKNAPSKLACVAFLLAGMARVDSSALAQQSSIPPRLGVQVKIQTFTAADAFNIRRTGFSFVRFGVWSDNLADPAYRSRVAAAFDAAAEAHLPVLLTIRSTAAPPRTDASTARSGNVELETAGKRFGRTVLEVAREHESQLLAVELWNEPDMEKYWPRGDVGTTFPIFMRGVCAALRAAPRKVPIYGFGFAHAPMPGTLPDALLKAVVGAAPGCIDAVSWHAYGTTPRAVGLTTQSIQARYRLRTSVTEWGTPSRGSRAASPAAQSTKISGFLDGLGGTGLELFSLYEWKDSTSGENAREQSFGLVEPDGMAKPAWSAVKAYLSRRGRDTAPSR